MCVFTPPIGCPTTELNSDAIYPETASAPTGEGLGPKDCPVRSFSHPSQSQVVPCASDQLAKDQRLPQAPPGV